MNFQIEDPARPSGWAQLDTVSCVLPAGVSFNLASTILEHFFDHGFGYFIAGFRAFDRKAPLQIEFWIVQGIEGGVSKT